MLRLRNGQTVLWKALLPPQARLLSEELAAVDALLADERFLAPFSARSACRVGRPTVPIETYLRLMYLKHRYHEALVKEVADSLSWRRFCRLALDEPIPHSTTLLKLTRRFGPEPVRQLNQALLKAAVERRLLRSRRLRVDTTVVEADIRYPTDSGLCAHAVSRLKRAVRRIKAVGLAGRTRFRDRSRRVGKLVRQMAHSLGRRGSQVLVQRITDKIRQVAVATVRQAARVLKNAQRAAKRGAPKGASLLVRLGTELERAERVIAQTAQRLAGSVSFRTG